MLRAEPWIGAALACELTLREREALMTVEDWSWLIDKYFEKEGIHA